MQLFQSGNGVIFGIIHGHSHPILLAAGLWLALPIAQPRSGGYISMVRPKMCLSLVRPAQSGRGQLLPFYLYSTYTLENFSVLWVGVGVEERSTLLPSPVLTTNNLCALC